MRRATLLLLVALASCGTTIPTYDEVVAMARDESRAPVVKDWNAKVFGPFWNAHVDGVALPCMMLIRSADPVVVRFVVDAGERTRPLRVRDESQTQLSQCLLLQLQELEWPVPPAEFRYVPIELALRRRPTESTDHAGK